MGTTFPVSIQDKEINALVDTGAEKKLYVHRHVCKAKTINKHRHQGLEMHQGKT